MTDVDRETLQALRRFAVGHVHEYGGLTVCHAIIDAGIALGMDDPTEGIKLPMLDLEGMQSAGIHNEDTINAFVERYRRLSEGTDDERH